MSQSATRGFADGAAVGQRTGEASTSTQVLPGSGIICPRAHRESPFELTEQEWLDTQRVLLRAKASIDERLQPDGYNLNWNVMPVGGQEVAHVHLHVIPRFADEPLARRGARWHLKQITNLRPNPLARGNGGSGTR